MGWKGTLRSVGAAIRASQREEQRRKRALEKRQKDIAKMQELEQAAYEVDVYENHIALLLSVHKECSEPIDWVAMLKSPRPDKPVNEQRHEKNFAPGLFTRSLGLEQRRKTKAIEKGKKAFQEALEKWNIEHADWKESKELAERLSSDPQSMIEVIEKLDPFSDISELGSSLSFQAIDFGVIEVTLHVHGEDVVPKERKSLLQSGKLSVKSMPKGGFNELYQDYVCSCILRAANELIAILPIKMVIVHAMDKLLSTQTGHLEDTCILSVAVARETIESLNMQMIDPSDSMKNFVHNMSFKKTKGFEPVDKISADRFRK